MNSIADGLKILGLLVLLPILIGHGINGGKVEQGTVVENQYTLTGSAAGTSMTGNGTLVIEVAGDQSSINLDPMINEADPEVELTVTLEEHQLFRVELTSHEVGARFGEVWLRASQGIVKLTHSLVADREGRFFDATYRLRPDDLRQPSVVQGPSMSSYILAGGRDGSEPIRAPGFLGVYLNNVVLHEGSVGDSNSPIVFDAEVGDDLEIVVTDVEAQSDYMSELWLHWPDGLAQRLSYRVELEAGTEFRAIYEID